MVIYSLWTIVSRLWCENVIHIVNCRHNRLYFCKLIGMPIKDCLATEKATNDLVTAQSTDQSVPIIYVDPAPA